MKVLLALFLMAGLGSAAFVSTGMGGFSCYGCGSDDATSSSRGVVPTSTASDQAVSQVQDGETCDAQGKACDSEGTQPEAGDTEAVVAEKPECGSCDTTPSRAALLVGTEGVTAEEKEDCDTCETCDKDAAEPAVELTAHGQAVQAMGLAGKPVWVKEAGYGYVNGEKVGCPVMVATAATHHMAQAGAADGCGMCEQVLTTAHNPRNRPRPRTLR
ncbi:MAG: hypothetical protein AAGH88_00855 [Planctomycetota bacterium]